MEGVLEKTAVKRVSDALKSSGISGQIKVLTQSARSAAEAAAGQSCSALPETRRS